MTDQSSFCWSWHRACAKDGMQNTSPKEKLVTDVKAVIDDSEKLMEATASDISDKLKAARNDLNDRFVQSKSKLVEMGEDLKYKAEESLKQTDRAIRSNPYQSLTAAFGLGLFMGILLNRR